MKIPVIYEDEWLLVVNKPSGLLTIPAPGKQKPTLIEILNKALKEKGLTYRLHPCHRLDKNTSGLIILAKGKSTQQKMMQEFTKKRVKKTYVAFIDGNIPKKHGEFIRTSIQGKPAITHYQVIKRLKYLSVVEVHLLTGLKNQIRIHFKRLGHPVLGEDKFAFRRDFKVRATRLCLHAQVLEFQHPMTKKSIYLKTELPLYFNNLLAKQADSGYAVNSRI